MCYVNNGDAMQDDWNTRLTLIERAQDPEDHSAWDDFVCYYKDFIKMVLNKSQISLNNMDDIIQDILLRVWKGLPNYEYKKDKAKFRTWLSVLIKNTILNHIAKAKRKGRDSKVELNEEALKTISESDLENVIASEWVNYLTSKAMIKVEESFSGNAIEVFTLSLKGVSARQIAAQLGMTEDSVFVLRSRVKSRLKKEIQALKQEIEFE